MNNVSRRRFLKVAGASAGAAAAGSSLASLPGLRASGESAENISAGVHASIASRIRAMAGNQVAEPVFFTGGVALIPGMDQVLGQVLGHPVQVAQNPQLTGALGAAILATRKK